MCVADAYGGSKSRNEAAGKRSTLMSQSEMGRVVAASMFIMQSFHSRKIIRTSLPRCHSAETSPRMEDH